MVGGVYSDDGFGRHVRLSGPGEEYRGEEHSRQDDSGLGEECGVTLARSAAQVAGGETHNAPLSFFLSLSLSLALARARTHTNTSTLTLLMDGVPRPRNTVTNPAATLALPMSRCAALMSACDLSGRQVISSQARNENAPPTVTSAIETTLASPSLHGQGRVLEPHHRRHHHHHHHARAPRPLGRGQQRTWRGW